MWWIPASGLGIIIVVFLAIILIRALLFVPPKKKKIDVEPVFVNSEKAVSDLANMIRCKTVSNTDPSLDDEGEFEKFEQLLPTIFPNVYSKCEFEKVGNRSLLFKWTGKHHDAPTVLMAHYDVVSVVEEDWDKPAFEGIIENGVLWGRGTLDTKGTLNGILQAAESLIGEGFIPKQDIYFAFGGNEEVNGTGALEIVELFKARKITPGAVIDEGGAVATGVFPGVKKPCAVIGIGEKGMLNMEYSVKGGGGHASSPAPITPIGRLARACVKVEKHTFKYRITKPTKELFNTLGRYSSFLYRLIFANQWCFKPILSLFSKASGGELNAVVRTTTAFTQMEGSKGMNVIPPYAKMVSNHRIIPGETVESVAAEIEKAVGDGKVSCKVLYGMNPSVISDTDCEAWDRVSTSVAETWQDAIVTPYLMVACSDSRHWGEVSDKVYRFSAMALSKEERSTIHGNNERVPLATVATVVEFYIRLMKKS